MLGPASGRGSRETVGDRRRLARVRPRRTPQALAARVGWRALALGLSERTLGEPTAVPLGGLAQALGVRRASRLGRVETPRPPSVRTVAGSGRRAVCRRRRRWLRGGARRRWE